MKRKLSREDTPLIESVRAAIKAAAEAHVKKNGTGQGGTWLQVTRTYLRIADTVIPAGTDSKERRAVYMAIYPFGERAMHPYKIWLKEVGEQMQKHCPIARAKALVREQERVAKRFRDTSTAATLQPKLFGLEGGAN